MLAGRGGGGGRARGSGAIGVASGWIAVLGKAVLVDVTRESSTTTLYLELIGGGGRDGLDFFASAVLLEGNNNPDDSSCCTLPTTTSLEGCDDDGAFTSCMTDCNTLWGRGGGVGRGFVDGSICA